MNEIQKLKATKKTENGDISYSTTGDNLTDIIFMSEFFSNNLDQVSIGDTSKEKLFSMFIRDPRYGLGKRDLGRVLMEQSGVSADNVVLAGRYDDLYHIATDETIAKLYQDLKDGNELAKKWAPRLTGKDRNIAKALCKMWGMSEKEYRALIKTDKTVEYKLSYAVKKDENKPLEKLFNEYPYSFPLVDEIDFEKVPSLAMHKYLNCFSTREDLKDRFKEYVEKVKGGKAKLNTSTANVYDAYKTATRSMSSKTEENAEVIANKTIDDATLGVEMDAIVILDTSGSMQWSAYGGSLMDKAMSLAYALSTHSTYEPNKVISFSSEPRLMTIKGDTLKEKYKSMYTGDCTITDFGAVMDLLSELEEYPEYLIVLTDMEFDIASSQSKDRTMKMFKERGANTKIIWWNLNDRNKTVPEFDEYGNIFLSGYNLQILKLLENKFDMTTYIDRLLDDYAKKLDLVEKEL